VTPTGSAERAPPDRAVGNDGRNDGRNDERDDGIRALSTRPRTRCRACAAEVPIASRCVRCSASLLHETCPCCGAEAGASPNRELYYICDVCAGPRIPRWIPPGGAPERVRQAPAEGPEAERLREAHAADKASGGWNLGAIVGIAILLCVVIGFGPPVLWLGGSPWLLVVAGVLVAPLVAFVALAFSRYRARRRDVQRAVDAAWLLAASDVAQQVDGLDREDGARLARILGVDELFADELLARLAVEDLAPSRARIAVAPPTTQRAPDAAPPDHLAAEVDAEAEAEAVGAAAQDGVREDAVPPTRVGRP
jgi:multisubunit Na+/H+ antiporter MnhG subunit